MKSFNARCIRRRTKPLYVLEDGRYIVYSKGKIKIADHEGKTLDIVGKIPTTFIKSILVKNRICERILRLEPRCFTFLEKCSYVFSFDGAIFYINIDTKEIKKEFTFRRGMRNPLCIERIVGINGYENCLCFGEYFSNPECQPINIYSRKIGRDATWVKRYTFSNEKINHIHAIVSDCHRDNVLVLTGDSDEGSGLWMFKNEFLEKKVILQGKQLFRSCAAIPLKESIIYATDTPLKQNYICKAYCENGQWRVKKIYSMPGPCIYYCINEKSIFFSTTVEPDSTKKGVKYLLTLKQGKGVTDTNVHLICYQGEKDIEEVISFKKDALPKGMFQFGSIQFVLKNKVKLDCYCNSLKGKDGKWIRIE